MPQRQSQSGAPALRGLAFAALLGLSGCGGALSGGANPHLSIEATAHALTTGAQLRLLATDPSSGNPVPARWSIAASDNAAALGPGSIDATGVYTAPGALSQDEITVTLTATTDDNVVSTQLTVTPGFAQPLTPENASVAPGQPLEVTARLAEVNAGSVSWSLQPVAGTAAAAQSVLGSLRPESCVRAPRQFTTCTATYLAPPASSPVPGPPAVRIIVTPPGGAPSAALHVLLSGSVTSNPATHQFQQSGPILLGSSGGNDNDFDTFSDASGSANSTNYIADCCGGTLGALVQDQSGQKYILSNNHVLAESDQGHIGDAIVQPGTIDDACLPLSEPGAKVRPVAALKASVPLDAPTTNVDAALASVAPGAVDASGAILELGAPVGGMLAAAPPTAGSGEVLTAANLSGLEVVKSGRTTGLTCSTVNSVELAVKVDYYRDCAETQPYTTKVFTGQIGIPGNSFSDAGDSGALVVDAANAQPVGLFYAGTTDASAESPGLSIANPIGEVLTALGARVGSTLSITGAASPHRVACLNYEAHGVTLADPLASLIPSERKRAYQVARAAQALVSSERGILGVAAGASADHVGEAAVLVYTDRARGAVQVPAAVEGTRTVLIATDAATLARGGAPVAASGEEGIHLPAAVLGEASRAVRQLSPELLADPAIFGVGATESLDSPQEAALLVLLDTTRPLPVVLTSADPATPGRLPATLGGLRVRYLQMHRFRVTRAKNSTTLSACRLRAQTGAGSSSSSWSLADAARRVFGRN